MMSGLLLWAGFALSAKPVLAAQSAYAAPVEYEVKAAFVHNFAKFIQWPDGKFKSKEAPIHIGFLGDGPINEALMGLKGKEVQSRTLKVSRVQNVKQVDSYHIIFVNPSEKKWLPGLMDQLRGNGILTIGDMKNFPNQCGIINFYLRKTEENGKKVNTIGFEINISAAEREQLKVSSHLLRLARIVEHNCH